jgi:hypothetical protein
MTHEDAMALAREFTSKHLFADKTDEERQKWEKTYAKRVMYEADFDEWLRLRAAKGHDLSDEQSRLNSCREDDLILSLLVTPAVLPWIVFKKFEVIEYALGKFADDNDATWGEQMAVIALAGIKTDLMRMGIRDEE